MPSDADIAAVARAIRQTYGARAAALMESRSKDYERAGAWARAEFWGNVARTVQEIDAAGSQNDAARSAPAQDEPTP